jgi:hypothetical protein
VTLTLELSSELDARLRQEAARAGLEPGDYVRRVLATHLQGAPAPAGSVGDVFARWRAQDGTTDAGEIARRQEEFERFKEAMNRSREQSDGPAARKPYP